MKQEPTKKQKTLATILLILAVVFIYKFYQSENIPVKKASVKKVKVEPFFVLQKNEDGFYTPENYLLDYYANINTKTWNYLLQHSLKQYDLNALKGQFDSKQIKGVKIVGVEKQGKEMAFVTANITYVNMANDTISKQVITQLQLSTDYKTWIVAPLTIF